MMKKLIFIILIFSLIACNKEKTDLKAIWIKQYLQEIKKYPDIHAINYWNETWENEDGTYCRLDINTSEQSLEAFQTGIADTVFISNCIFTDGKLQPVQGKKYYGTFPGLNGEEDTVKADRIILYDQLAGKPAAWTYFSVNWYDSLKFPDQAVRTISALGKTPFIRLMPRSTFDEYQPDPLWKLTDILAGKYDNQLRLFARAARDCGTNLLMEFGTEVNGAWFPWNGQYYGAGTTDRYGNPDYPDGPEIFRDTYRHIIDIFRQEGADNITWFFHIDVNEEPLQWWNQARYYYPGDQYIDWIGISTYGPTEPDEDYVSPDILLSRADSMMWSVSGNKPYAILEFGITQLYD